MSERNRRATTPRVDMPVRAPLDRAHDFGEVNLGYTESMAVAEAQRCIACRRPPCVEGCPVGVDIPAAKRLRAWPGAGPQQGHHRHHARFGLPVVDASTRPNWLTGGPRRHFGNACFSGHPRLRPDNGCVTGRPRPLLDHCASAPLRPHSPYWSSNARLGQIGRTGRPGFTSATSASPVGHRRFRQPAFVALPRGHVEPRCHGSRHCNHRQTRQLALIADWRLPPLSPSSL